MPVALCRTMTGKQILSLWSEDILSGKKKQYLEPKPPGALPSFRYGDFGHCRVFQNQTESKYRVRFVFVIDF